MRIDYTVRGEATLAGAAEQTIAADHRHPRRTGPRAGFAGLALAILTAGVATLLFARRDEAAAAFHAVNALMVAPAFWQAAGVGLVAQIVDGALGMAYGLTATSFLLSTGVSPAAASASVHLSEVFTTGFSGLAHWKLGNVNGRLFRRLVLPGVAGGITGAYVLTSFDGATLKPWINGYLLLMGLYILAKVFRRITLATEPPTYVAPLAAVGGFVDAVGGGGWGPVVTSTLLGSGQEPRRTIGSVNAAEFFISAATGVSLAMFGGVTALTTMAGLIAGGMFAAPVAAWLTRYAPVKVLMAMVGLLIVGLSLYNSR